MPTEDISENYDDESPLQESVWRDRRINERGPRNNVPMTRFLESKVGQKWSDIYSEICSRKDLGYPSMSSKQQAYWGVEKNVVMDDSGFPCNKATGKPLTTYKNRGFFIHPDTGILLRIPVSKKQEKPQSPFIKKILSKTYWKLGAGWFEMEVPSYSRFDIPPSKNDKLLIEQKIRKICGGKIPEEIEKLLKDYLWKIVRSVPNKEIENMEKTSSICQRKLNRLARLSKF